jgi:hypothetical protein
MYRYATERVVITGKYGGTTAELFSVEKNAVVLSIDAATSNSAEDMYHGVSFELEYDLGTDGAVMTTPAARWALFVNGGAVR